jgi:hypothetical protein
MVRMLVWGDVFCWWWCVVAEAGCDHFSWTYLLSVCSDWDGAVSAESQCLPQGSPTCQILFYFPPTLLDPIRFRVDMEIIFACSPACKVPTLIFLLLTLRSLQYWYDSPFGPTHSRSISLRAVQLIVQMWFVCTVILYSPAYSNWSMHNLKSLIQHSQIPSFTVLSDQCAIAPQNHPCVTRLNVLHYEIPPRNILLMKLSLFISFAFYRLSPVFGKWRYIATT